MHEQANTQLVQQAYRNFQTGDIPSVLNVLAEDVLWQLPEMENVLFAGTWHGRKEVERFFSRSAGGRRVSAGGIIAQGSKVVVLGRFTMHVKATDRASRSAWVHVWTVEGDKVNHVREYVDTFAVSRAHTLAQAD